MRIFFLTFGGTNTASTRYRVLQYFDLFLAAHIDVGYAPVSGFKCFEQLREYDTVILQKTIVPLSLIRKLRQVSRRLLYDIDDRIWLSPNKQHGIITRLRIAARIRAIAKNSDLCIAANEVIADDLRRAGGNVAVVPMSLDEGIWHPRTSRNDDALVVGWSGAPKNLAFLERILPELKKVQRQFPKVRWHIHSGENPHFSDFDYLHIPYVAGEEHLAVGAFDIGLLPLPNDPFVKGKSPIKALQYLACKVAVVGECVGATQEILEDGVNALCGGPGEWGSALAQLITNATLRNRLAAAGRLCFETAYERRVVFDKYLNVINSVGH